MIRILLLADTHLGFDYPFRPRIERRRRGPDFFRNFERALEPAYRGEVDLVVHGGDIFYRSKVPAQLVEMAFMPLRKVADKEIPVYIVPGNHERSAIPFRLLAGHPNIFIFDQPTCFLLTMRGFTLALAGFPFVRNNIREKFPYMLQQTKWSAIKADAYLLCIHQSVDGAITGPRNYTFRGGKDVIDIHDIPAEFAGVLNGHMHRFQVLEKDLRGKPVATPILYSGSTERTSFAEKDEKKGYVTLDIQTDGRNKGAVHAWTFHELPTRPMLVLECNTAGMNGKAFESWLKDRLAMIPHDSIVKIRIHGKLRSELFETIRAESIRSLAPKTMNISITLVDYRGFGEVRSRSIQREQF
ncbi:MAG: DNA repair exonuclease [candidate division WOR-3 bacterium]|nr:MAG: DNA repair exonuclease [candidate division WOR-3 bacterium]